MEGRLCVVELDGIGTILEIKKPRIKAGRSAQLESAHCFGLLLFASPTLADQNILQILSSVYAHLRFQQRKFSGSQVFNAEQEGLSPSYWLYKRKEGCSLAFLLPR